MSAQIKYAYLKQHTWIYRRNWPKDVALVLGAQALKQSLKTHDTSLARVRAAEVNASFEVKVSQVRAQATEAAQVVPDWAGDAEHALGRLRASLETSEGVLERAAFTRPLRRPKVLVSVVGRAYLGLRSNELRPGGFKSVRYSVGLFLSHYGERSLCSLTRDDGRAFLSLVAQLSPLLGRSESSQGLSLEQSVRWSSYSPRRITGRTQKRIWDQVNHFLNWAVYQGQLAQNPFSTVAFEAKIRKRPYAVPTDEEVVRFLGTQDRGFRAVLLLCLLSGLRAGEAVGLLRDDLVSKGNLGTFLHVRPNHLRLLKTDAAERLVPVHPALQSMLVERAGGDAIFPDMTVNWITKRFSDLRQQTGLERPGLVFHSTRKWFITQCERTGVPEHFTASLVGHKSARSENGITYGIYSAGISDEQRRSIVDQIRLPPGVVS